jgi:outer membrane protein OmpA-like peptidoglycan-associated protein
MRTSSATFGALYNLSPDAKFTVQALGGAGIQWWNVMDARGGDPGVFGSAPTAVGFKEDGHAVPLINSNILTYLGIGAEMAITSKLTLGANVRVDYLFHSATDNTGASDTLGVSAPPATQQQIQAAVAKAKSSVDANDLIPSVWFGLTYWFGERDGDGDGIPNSTDKCPDRAEDRDTYQDEDGCPDEDDDGDGILDAVDKCAKEAEDKDGFEDEDGCPDLDNDKDGVPDAQDACVDVPEDKDTFQDADGCPDFDNDGDAVADSVDQCNDTPAGVPVDEQGCPRTMRLEQSRVLRGVGFKSGTAELTGGYATLDSVVAAMRAYPKIDLEVHTSVAPSGQKAREETLSQQRADAVIAYLVQHGADRSRLTGIGFGAAPLASDGSLTSAAGVDAVAIRPAAALPPIEEPQKPKE